MYDWIKDNKDDWSGKTMEIRMPTHLMNILDDDIMYKIAKLGKEYNINISINGDRAVDWNEVWIIDAEELDIKEKISIR